MLIMSSVYAVLVRCIAIIIIPIISFILLLVFMKKRKAQIIVLLSTVAVFFFMFFFAVYVRVPNINETTVEKLWNVMENLDYEPPETEEAASVNRMSYTEENEDYSIFAEKWETEKKLDLSYACEGTNYLPNGMYLFYKILKTGGEGNDYVWIISPLSAERAEEGFSTFMGWYEGNFIINKGNQYIRCRYYVKTSFGNLSGFMCIPPIGFDLEEFIMQFA